MTQQDHMSVVIMVIVGLLTSFFSKNMVVIMCIALVVTNLLKYGTRLRSEGFKTMAGEEDEEKEDDDDDEEDEEEDDDDKEADDKEVEDDQEAALVLEEKESFRNRKGNGKGKQ